MSMLQSVSQFNEVINTVIGDLFAAALANMNTRVAAASSTLTVGTNLLPGIVANVAAAQAAASAQLTAETSNRLVAKMGMDASITSLSTSIANNIAAAVADRSTIRSRGLSNSPTASISSAVASALSTEASRGAAESTQRINIAASVRTARSAAAAQAFADEFTRANSSCSNTILGGNGAFVPPVTTGANEYAAWYVDCNPSVCSKPVWLIRVYSSAARLPETPSTLRCHPLTSFAVRVLVSFCRTPE